VERLFVVVYSLAHGLSSKNIDTWCLLRFAFGDQNLTQDRATREDFLAASQASTGRIGQRPKPEAAQCRARPGQATSISRVTMKLCSDSETQSSANLLNQFRERWIALEGDCAVRKNVMERGDANLIPRRALPSYNRPTLNFVYPPGHET
jgi:hypothetical protein